MFRKLQAAAMLMCMVSYAAAGTVSIGTASARGDMRVDSYRIKGNATLFDGSQVQTGQASADLRLEKGVEITLSESSRATLYRDHMVLEQGETELTASSPFRLEASVVRVTANNPDSRWTVSLRPGNTVEVTALTGAVGVTNQQGIMLANVLPGRPLSFAMQQGESSSAFAATGTISLSYGHYFLTVIETGTTYELVGANLSNLVGEKVTITGTILPNATPVPPATAVIQVQKSKKAAAGAYPGVAPAATGWSSRALLIAGIIVAAGVGLGVGIYESTQPSTPASR